MATIIFFRLLKQTCQGLFVRERFKLQIARAGNGDVLNIYIYSRWICKSRQSCSSSTTSDHSNQLVSRLYLRSRIVGG